MLTYILFTIFILACIVLVISVLLQPGKADAGALFTSSISSTAFGPRGTQTILAKITIGAAATFMIVALLLGMGVGGQRSLMEGAKSKASPTPAPPPRSRRRHRAKPRPRRKQTAAQRRRTRRQLPRPARNLRQARLRSETQQADGRTILNGLVNVDSLILPTQAEVAELVDAHV